MPHAKFLDVEVYRGAGWERTGILDTRVHSKPTSLWIPLGISSFHPASIHTSWPTSQLLRYKRICSSHSQYVENARKLSDQIFRCNGIHMFQNRATMRNHSANPKQPSSRIVLPHTVPWAHAKMGTILKHMREKWAPCLGSSLFQSAEHVGLAWRLGGVHVQNELRSMNQWYHESDKDKVLRW